MAFHFKEPVDPKNPIDPCDLPPKDWVYVDAHDYRRALFGFPDKIFTDCVKWEERELKRHQTVQ